MYLALSQLFGLLFPDVLRSLCINGALSVVMCTLTVFSSAVKSNTH